MSGAPTPDPRLRRAVAAVLATVVWALLVAPAAAAEGPGYGGDGGGLEVTLLRDGDEVAGPVEGAAGAAGYSVGLRGAGWLAATTLTVEVPGAPPTVAATDDTGAFRTVVPVPTSERPSGIVRVEGAGPDLATRAVTGAVPSPSPGVDLRIALLGLLGAAVAASVVVPHVRQRRADGPRPAAGGPA